MILISQHNRPGTVRVMMSALVFLWCIVLGWLHWRSTQYSQVFGEIICIIILFHGPVAIFCAFHCTVWLEGSPQKNQNKKKKDIQVFQLIHLQFIKTKIPPNHPFVPWSSNGYCKERVGFVVRLQQCIMFCCGHDSHFPRLSFRILMQKTT